jgi:hypothetical protein
MAVTHCLGFSGNLDPDGTTKTLALICDVHDSFLLLLFTPVARHWTG